MTLGNFNDTQNKKIVGNLIDNLKLNPLTDAIPRQVVPTIQPVYDAKQDVTEYTGSVLSSASGNATILHTDTNRDTYITYITLSFIKNATCDVATGNLSITCSVGGLGWTIARLSVLTATAQEQSICIPLSKPIRVDRNTDINMIADSHSAGVYVKSAVVGVYLGDLGINAQGI